MSIAAMKLCSLILQEHFGENVRIVGQDLFCAKSKSLAGICGSTKLSKKQVASSLAILVQYRLVKFNPLETNENAAEYTLLYDRILLFLRYPRFTYFIQKKFGNPSALLLEELLKCGTAIAQSVIARAYSLSDVKNTDTLKELRDSFLDLVGQKYFVRCPEVTSDSVPKLKVNIHDIFIAPDINLKELNDTIDKGLDPADVVQEKIYWTANFDKFHQTFRDKILVDCIERQIDSNAAECFQFIISLMYNKTDPWAPKSNPISLNEIRQAVKKKSSNTDLVKYLDQYVSIIEKDECGFLGRNDDFGGEAYDINMFSAFKQITWSIIENVITQKFGAKAARIFRVIRTKKYIEQDDIQREAMIPSKEARLYTYKLLEENFIQIQTIKKAGSGMGPTKSFYLFYVNQQHIARDVIETCYKSLYNLKIRVNQDKEANKRLMEKAIRLQFIVEALKERGESEETIQDINETLTPPEKEIVENAKMRLNRLESSEIMVDEMLLMLQLYLQYYSPATRSFYTGKILLDYTEDIGYAANDAKKSTGTVKSILKRSMDDNRNVDEIQSTI